MVLTAYELERDARIAANRKRMEELNIPALSSEFHSCLRRKQVKRARKTRALLPSALPNQPSDKRRSGRLVGKAAPEYNEATLLALDRADIRGEGRQPYASKEEVYTEKHVKMLGQYTEEWELFKDGYDSDGNRIYSKESGLTCHQCRQKTLGARTSCSCCQSLKGVFCGDCLFMRYGENVKEANLNPKWVCPSCRDICNCSIHRIRKGWAPTGSLYRHAIAAGYRSVAHYIVLNNLSNPSVKTAKGTEDEAIESTEPKALAAGETAPKTAAPDAKQKAPAGLQQQITDMLPQKRRSNTIRAAKKLSIDYRS